MVDFGAMIVLNQTGVFLWKLLQEDKTESQLLQSVLSEYDVDQQSAKQDIREFIDTLIEKDLVVSDNDKA